MSARIVITRGAADTDARPGALDFLLYSTRFGASGRSRSDIFSELGRLSTDLSTSSGMDSATLSILGTSEHFQRSAEIAATLLLKPEFAQNELERHKQYLSAHLDQEVNDAAAVARRTFSLAIFGPGHPYGRIPVGTPQDIRALTRDEIVALHAAAFVPSNATIVAAGDLQPGQLIGWLEPILGSWKGKATARKPIALPAADSSSAARIVVINRPGAPQSHIVFGGIGPPRNSPDWDAAEVLNTLYGGSNSSRLARSLRSQLGYTWSGLSVVYPRRGPALFYWEGEVAREATADSLREIQRRVKEIREQAVPPSELRDAKERVRLGLPGKFETVADITERLAEVAVYDLPMNTFDTAQQRTDAVSAADLKRVASQWMDPSRTKAVIVGDWQAIKASLKALSWSSIELRDTQGRVLAIE